MSSSLGSLHVLVLVLLTLCTTAGVSGCSVTPSAAAVAAGDDLSLTCMTQDNSDFAYSWRLESGVASAQLLYVAPIFNRNGSISVESKVADEYLVNDSNYRQVILTIIKASTVQANYYYCLCSRSSSAFAHVSVLESEPACSNATEITDGKPVIFTCRVSFNGSANTSITIEDSSLKRFTTGNYVASWRGLHSFSLDYKVTADSSINHEFSCYVALISDTSKTMIYSKKFNASVEWVPVRSVQIHPVDSKRCINGKQCAANQRLRCTAEANPKPVSFQWKVYFGGVQMKDVISNQLTLSNEGNYTIQCMSFNQIRKTLYSNISDYFKIEVVSDGSSGASEGEGQNTETNNNALIIGLVVGLLGSVIAAAIIALTVVYCRRKRRKKRQQTESGVEAES